MLARILIDAADDIVLIFLIQSDDNNGDIPDPHANTSLPDRK